MDAIVKHEDYVRRHVARLSHARNDLVDDYVQETMLAACRAIDKYGFPLYPRAWLFRIADRIVGRSQQSLRRAKSRLRVLGHVDNGGAVNVLDQVVKQDELARLRSAVDRLPGPDYSVIQQYYWHDQSCRQIGEHMGMTEPAIKTRLHRSRAKIGMRLGAKKRR